MRRWTEWHQTSLEQPQSQQGLLRACWVYLKGPERGGLGNVMGALCARLRHVDINGLWWETTGGFFPRNDRIGFACTERLLSKEHAEIAGEWGWKWGGQRGVGSKEARVRGLTVMFILDHEPWKTSIVSLVSILFILGKSQACNAMITNVSFWGWTVNVFIAACVRAGCQKSH